MRRKRKSGQYKPPSQKRSHGRVTTAAGPEPYFSTVSAGLRSLAPKSSGTNVQGALHAVCRDLGRWAHLATITLNGVLQDDSVLEYLAGASEKEGRPTGQGLTTIVAKVWRATEEVLKGRSRWQQAPDPVILKAVQEVLPTELPRELANGLPTMHSMLKDPVALDISTEWMKMLKLFPDRLRGMLRVLLFDEVGGSVGKTVVENVAEKMLDAVLAPSLDATTTDGEANDAATHSACQKVRGCTQAVAEVACAIVRAQRAALGPLVADSVNDRRRSARDSEGALRASVSFIRAFDDAGLVLLVPRLRDISRWAEAYVRGSSHSPAAELEPAGAEAALVVDAPPPADVATAEPALAQDFGWAEAAGAAGAEVALVVDAPPPADVATAEPALAQDFGWAEAAGAEAALAVDSPTGADPSRRLGVLSALRSTVAAGGDRWALIESAPFVEAGVVYDAPVEAGVVYDAPVEAGVVYDAGEPAAVAPADKRVRKLPREWRPKGFSLSPMHELKSASVRFSCTTEKAFFEQWRGNKLRDDRGGPVALPSRRDVERFEQAIAEKRVGAPLVALEKVFRSRRSRAGACAGVAEWGIAAYTTNGVQTCVHFVQSREWCRTAELNLGEVGARVALEGARSRSSRRRAAIPASPHLHRGCLTVGHGASDGRPLEPHDDAVMMVGVDPGGGQTERTAAFARCRSDERPLDAAFGHVGLSAHKGNSGAERAREAEERRLQLNPEYKKAVQQLRDCGSSTKSASASYQLYVDAALATFLPRARELTCFEHTLVLWMRRRSKMSADARAADLICDMVSTRPERVAKREEYAYPCGWPRLDKEERDALAERLRLRIAQLRAERTLPKPKLPVVVFYGDGWFSSAFPHNRVRRLVALRGLLFQTNEAYTSSNCPCSWGGYLESSGLDRWTTPDSTLTCCKLIDVADVVTVGSAPAAATDTPFYRLRTCNRDGSGTRCVVERVQHIPRVYHHRRVCYDRDHLAALNILLLGRCALFGLERPKAFCWPVREEAA